MTRLRQEFQTVRSEGGLLPPDLLRRLLDRHSALAGTRPEDYGLSPGERLNEVITHSLNRLRRHYGEFHAAAANLPDGEAGTARLRHLAGRIKGSRHGDLWRQFRLLADPLSGEPDFESARRRLALPALSSFLWSRESTPELNDAELTNLDFLEALRHLAFTRQNKVLRPVDYRNLGTEELGGVYEGLLALTPRVSGDGADFTFAEFAGNARKTSGSYYTPDSLVQCLLDSALDPVVKEARRGKSGADAERAILDLKICDPAVGSGHFLVGAAHRLARHLARVRAHAAGESEPSPLLYRSNRDGVSAWSVVRVICTIGMERIRDVRIADLAMARYFIVEVCAARLSFKRTIEPARAAAIRATVGHWFLPCRVGIAGLRDVRLQLAKRRGGNTRAK